MGTKKIIVVTAVVIVASIISAAPLFKYRLPSREDAINIGAASIEAHVTSYCPLWRAGTFEITLDRIQLVKVNMLEMWQLGYEVKRESSVFSVDLFVDRSIEFSRLRLPSADVIGSNIKC